ncbi:MAG: endo-1,3-alpha-glucanase family glycosylhydrolase, partial [Thermofilaceae archaeon]
MRQGTLTLMVIVAILFTLFVSGFTCAQEYVVYYLIVEVETNSDWTTVTITGFTAYNFSLIEGLTVPDLKVSATGGSISINKKQYDATLVRMRVKGWLMFTDATVNVTVVKGDIGYTIVRVLVPGVEKTVWEFTNTGVVPGSSGFNPRSSHLPRVTLTEASKVRELAVPRLVLAFYYPWYGTPQGASGRWFHWRGISYTGIGSSTDYPLLGPYDSWDPRVVRSHIKMAKAVGIDGFVISWWGIRTFEDEAFARMLDVAAEEHFNMTIYYESARELTAEQIIDELSYVLRKYAEHPVFLKIEGRPVIFIYAVEAYSRTPDFWNHILKSVEKATGIKALYIADIFDITYLTVFNGLHTYNPIWIQDHISTYLKQSRLVKSYVDLGTAESLRKLWIATVNPGYDDRKIREPGAYVSREAGAYYRKTWEAALASEPDIIIICTWNEWHEGTEIEPSREHGFQYLD